MRRLLQVKILHFFVLGLALYGLSASYRSYQQRQLQCPTVSDVESMLANWAQQNRQPVSPGVRSVLIQAALDEQMLIREAQIKRLHKYDDIVLQRLQRDAEFLGISGSRAEQITAVLNMGLLESDEVIRRRLIQIQEQQVAARLALRQPSEKDLRDLLAKNPELAERPPRYSFDQLFFAGVGNDTKQRAAEALKQVRRGEDVLDADVFLSGNAFYRMASTEINAVFGPEFWSDSGTNNPPDQWFGPLQSVYGWHLINIREYYPRGRRDFAELGAQLHVIWRRAQERVAWQDYVAALRGQYRVICHEKI